MTTFGGSLNYPSFPFNNTPGGMPKIPNPSQTIATWNPTAWKNLIANATTSTGIWNYALVLGAKVSVEALCATDDRGQMAMAPLLGGGSYGFVESMISSPGSVQGTAQPGRRCRLSKYISVAQTAGLPDHLWFSQYQTYSCTSATAPTTQVYWQFYIATGSGMTFTKDVLFSVTIHYRVRFFGREDTLLLEN